MYHRITKDTFFHLKLEFLSPTSNGELQPDTPIEITVTLQPQLLSSLPKTQLILTPSPITWLNSANPSQIET